MKFFKNKLIYLQKQIFYNYLFAMKNFLTPYHSIDYHCFEIRMVADSDVVFDAWAGAILRNNLLYAAGKISVEEQTCSLRELIDKFPLAETHPLYKELKEGFPKGYVLSGFSHANFESEAVLVRKGEIFIFSLKLIGNFNDYRFYFFEAIRLMCKRGIGKPLTSFTLLDISEKPVVRLADFLASGVEDEFSEITLRYKTPVILFRLKSKKNTQLSYQDKSNRFPGFYQLVRSAFFRMQKLYAVYVEPTTYTPPLFEETVTETYLEKAGYPLLQSADIRYVSLQNTQKKEKKNEMPLSGYVGEQVYSGYFQKYLPLLKFMEGLGVGNETVYGMGRYEIENEIINQLKIK